MSGSSLMFSGSKRLAISWAAAFAMFALVAVACDVFCTCFVIFGNNSFDAAKISRLIHVRSPEVPIFGSSQARDDYVPELIHPEAFNYGMVGASFEVIDLFLHIELAKNNTRPIIIAMTHSANRGIGDVSNFIPFAERPDVRGLLLRNGSMQWRFNIPGLRYFGYYGWYLKDFVAERQAVAREADRGYTTAFGRVLPWDRSDFERSVKRRLKSGYGFKSDPDQDARLFRDIRQYPARKFVLVYSPLHSACFANFTGAPEFGEFLAKLRSMNNVVVLDWSQLGFPDQYFADTLHLNETGAAEFSRRLGAELRPILGAAN